MKTVAIDFDGVIHKYGKGWRDGSIYDEEVKGALEAILRFQNSGWAVYILSTRNPYQIKRWLDDQQDIVYIMTDVSLIRFRVIPWWMFWKKFWNSTKVVAITQKKLAANVYVDDRAVKFDGDWDMTYFDVFGLKTWQGK
jgi:hypothetical protein